jgi:hypothetical protein
MKLVSLIEKKYVSVFERKRRGFSFRVLSLILILMMITTIVPLSFFIAEAAPLPSPIVIFVNAEDAGISAGEIERELKDAILSELRRRASLPPTDPEYIAPPLPDIEIRTAKSTISVTDLDEKWLVYDHYDEAWGAKPNTNGTPAGTVLTSPWTDGWEYAPNSTAGTPIVPPGGWQAGQFSGGWDKNNLFSSSVSPTNNGAFPRMRLYDWVYRTHTNLCNDGPAPMLNCINYGVTASAFFAELKPDDPYIRNRPGYPGPTVAPSDPSTICANDCPSVRHNLAWNGRPRAQTTTENFRDHVDTLGAFDRHILASRDPVTGEPRIDFVGYSELPRQDFLLYLCRSSDMKEVTFDVSSVETNAHTLDGAGFLINTLIHDGSGGTGDTHISGYLLYYVFPNAVSINARPSHLVLYRLDNVLLSALRTPVVGNSFSNVGIIKDNNNLAGIAGVSVVSITGTGANGTNTPTTPFNLTTGTLNGTTLISGNIRTLTQHGIRVSNVDQNPGTTTLLRGRIVEPELTGAWAAPFPNWEPRMTIKLYITPTSIEVKHSVPFAAASAGIGALNTGIDWSTVPVVLSYDRLDIGSYRGNGFGPYVGYNRHGCNRASMFTFLKLEMEYIRQFDPNDILGYIRSGEYPYPNPDFVVDVTDLPRDPDPSGDFESEDIDYINTTTRGRRNRDIIDEIARDIIERLTPPPVISPSSPWARLQLMHVQNPAGGDRVPNTVTVINRGSITGSNIVPVYGFDTSDIPLSVPSDGSFYLIEYYYLITNRDGQPIDINGNIIGSQLATPAENTAGLPRAPDGRPYTVKHSSPNQLLLNVTYSPYLWPSGTYTVALFVQDNSVTNDFSPNIAVQTFEIIGADPPSGTVSNVFIHVFLDDELWNANHPWVGTDFANGEHNLPAQFPYPISIRRAGTTDPGIPVNPVTGAQNVPPGVYDILVSGVPTGQRVVVTPGYPPSYGRLDYYSVRLIAGPGTSSPSQSGNSLPITIENVPVYESIAIYLPGTQVTVNIFTPEDYHFYGWMSDYDTSRYDDYKRSFTFTTPLYTNRTYYYEGIGRDLTLTAYAVGQPEVGFVFVTVDQPGSYIWDDSDTPDVVLVNEGGERFNSTQWDDLDPDRYQVIVIEKDGYEYRADIFVYIEYEYDEGTGTRADMKYPVYRNERGNMIPPIIYYYVLTLVAEAGTQSPSVPGLTPYYGAGTNTVKYRLRAGTYVDLNVDVIGGAMWIDWNSYRKQYQENIEDQYGNLTMPRAWLRLYARAGYEVIINLNLDDRPWTGADGQAERPIVALRPVGGGPDITDLSNVPPGDYYIVIIDAGREDVIPDIFTVGPGRNERTIDYYTLTLEGDAGIGSLFGAGRYRAGVSVEISAGLLSGFDWVRWIELGGGAEFNSYTRTWTLIMPARPLTLRATSVASDAEYEVEADTDADADADTGTDTNTARGHHGVPQTGITRNIVLPVLMLTIAAGCLGAAELYRRKKPR